MLRIASRATRARTHDDLRIRTHRLRTADRQVPSRHFIAEMQTKLDAAQTYLDQCVLALNEGQLSDQDAAGLKWWTSEIQWEIMDRCLQIYGGYGYINEYEVARLWRDARVQRLYGGTTEIMKDLMGRAMGF